MTWTTVLASEPALGYHTQIDRWETYVGLDHPRREQLVDALMDAQIGEIQRLLPEGCRWLPDVSEIVGPVGADLSTLYDTAHGDDEDRMASVMEEASERVADRLEEIEARVLGT